MAYHRCAMRMSSSHRIGWIDGDNRASIMLARRSFLASSLAVAGTLAAGRAFGAGEPPVTVKADLTKIFSDANTEGTMAVLDANANTLTLTDETRTRSAILPASTFKIPNSLIALETGVIADADVEVIKWDGVDHGIPEWNQDHTLRSAIKFSVVPVYQQLARRIGAERMQRFVDAFDYGNKNIGGGIDRFWLTGDLRISPIDQTRFLSKLLAGTLPVSERTLTLVKDIVPVEKTDSAVIHYKTGLLSDDGMPTGKSNIGWVVGWVERGEASMIFAMNMDVRTAPHVAQRLPLTKLLLAGMGVV
jgi:beta-lactamase class D